MEITRRTALGLFGAVAVPASATVAVAAAHVEQPESAADKVERLAHELADALNDYSDGKFSAVVVPSDTTDWPVTFRRRDSDLRQAVAEAKAALQRAYPSKRVHADIRPYRNGEYCNVMLLTHDGEMS